MKTICSECNFSFRVPKQMEGRSVKCPQCRNQIEISKSPTPPLVKLLEVVLIAILAASISGVMCWGYFTMTDQAEVARKVYEVEKFFEKKLNAEQQKIEAISILLKAKTDAASKSALLTAEEIDALNDELIASRELLEQKDSQILFVMDSLSKLNESVTTEAQQKEHQQQLNLQQALQKGSDVWSLSGIGSLGISVTISGQVSEYQLKEDDIIKYIQTSLEQNGIETETDSDADMSKDAVLLFEIFILENDEPEKAGSINVKASVKQTSRLLRDDTIISVGASTWQRQRWHSVTSESAGDAVITMIDDLLERFINDFQTSNTL